VSLALGRDGAACDVGLLAAGALTAICPQWLSELDCNIDRSLH
jgi:hypothetical protein